MDSLIIYFLPTILALGIVTSYEDVTEGKIRNKYVIAGLIIGFIIHLILIWSGLIGWKHFFITALYASLVLIIGFSLWYFGWWNAGDAKLLAVFVFLTPITTYKFITTQLPFLEIGFNALIPIFIYLLITLIIRTKTRSKIEALKKTFEPKRLFLVIIAIFSISWLNMYIFNWFGIKPNIIFNVLLIIFFLKLIEKVLKEQTFALLTLVAILRIFLNTKYFTTKSFLISFLIMIIIYLIVMGFIRQLAETYTKKTSVYALQEGMVLAEWILKSGFTTPLKKFRDEKYICTKTKPLIEEDILKIQKWHKTGKLHFNKINVTQTTIFAPHIFLGTLITMICQGNMVMFLRSVLNI